MLEYGQLSEWTQDEKQYILEIWLVVRVDIVDLDAACLVVLEVSDNLVGIRLAPVARLACSVGDTAQRAAVVVRAYADYQLTVPRRTRNGERPIRRSTRDRNGKVPTSSLHVTIGAP